MKNSEKDYQRLFHIVKYCQKLQAVRSSVQSSYAQFVSESNYEKVDVSSFYIGQIGGLTHGLTDEFKQENQDIPWRQINDMRNVLIHRYGERDTRVIWDVITKDIPLLEEKCRAILKTRKDDVKSRPAPS